MQHHIFPVTDFLIHQESLHIGSLISGQLNHFTGFFIFLHRPVAGKILFERLANALHVQIVRQARHRRDTLATIALLDAHVHLFFRRHSPLVAGVFKGVCMVVVINIVGQTNNTIIGRVGG